MTASHRRRAGTALVAAALALSVACAKEEPKAATPAATTGVSAVGTTAASTPSSKATDGTKPGTTSTSKATRTTGASGGGATGTTVYTNGDDGDAAAAMLLETADLGSGNWQQEPGSPDKDPNPLVDSPGCAPVQDAIAAADDATIGEAKTEWTDDTNNRQISQEVEMYQDEETVEALRDAVLADEMTGCLEGSIRAEAAKPGEELELVSLTVVATDAGLDADDLGVDWVAGFTMDYELKSGASTTVFYFLTVFLGSGDATTRVSLFSMEGTPEIGDLADLAAAKLLA